MPSQTQSNIRPSLVALITSLLFAILGGVAFINESQILIAQRLEEDRTQATTRSLRDLYENIEAMETGQRGYLLTGHASYLEPFEKGRNALKASFEELSMLIRADIYADQNLPDDLGTLIQLKQAELEKTITLRRQGKLSAALEIVNSNAGQDHMIRIHDLVMSHVNHYRTVHEKLLHEAQNRTQLTQRLFVSWLLVIAIMVALAFWNIRLVNRALKDMATKLSIEATHDPLTGLPNRRFLSSWLDASLATAARHDDSIALLYIDLDGFSVVNDTLGHDAGDTALCWVCSLFKSKLRESDFLARLGGDEFVVVTSNQNEQGAARVAQRLIDSLEASPPLEGVPKGALGASIGIAFSTYGVTAENLLASADKAMYQAKLAGKRCYHLAGPCHDFTAETTV
ncbi:diguanylate cyclase (GGDEF)-like protein [Pseudomonas duriflava]|uniref:Diguanylate cyclase (GGDEF)-like protein n=1 Tax=Pseudomonas duriflava TaxID=459528 RepID=A0A562PR13_9PSED|nr:diguanylate cyclase [Pseudomonas duriflava]TWI46875.1 diguanylate cyclase (GGDEF)-like protein [Pseudomonas duriflava]